MEEIFDMAIVEDPLETKLRTTLQAHRVETADVIAVVRRVRTCVFRMEERQQITFRIHHRGNPLNHRLHERLGKVIGNVPAKHGVKFDVIEDEIFAKKAINIHAACTILAVSLVFGILRGQENILVVNAVSELRKMSDVCRRSRTEI